MPHVRCSKCQGRTTLKKHPKDYTRIPPCRHCGRKMEHDPVSIRTPHYRIDHWRAKHEVGRGLKLRGNLCYPGRGGCNGYHHPHRKGSRWCEHNPKLTAEELQERYESGGRC